MTDTPKPKPKPKPVENPRVSLPLLDALMRDLFQR